MGMFDSLYVGCKECGEMVEFQSKVGKCYLNKYTIDNCPTEIALNLNGEISICNKCGCYNKLQVQALAFIQVL